LIFVKGDVFTDPGPRDPGGADPGSTDPGPVGADPGAGADPDAGAGAATGSGIVPTDDPLKIYTIIAIVIARKIIIII
jgi:hypothetical protein